MKRLLLGFIGCCSIIFTLSCREAGHGFVVVLGHREYYPRFGFIPASRFNLACEYDVPDDHFMALELVDGALRGCAGVVKYQVEFNEA